MSKRAIERVEGSHTALEGDLRRVESAKNEHCHHLLAPLSLLTCMTLFLLRNTKEGMLNKVPTDLVRIMRVDRVRNF